MSSSRSNSSGSFTPSRVLTDTGSFTAANTSSKNRSSSSGFARKPAPLPLAVTVPEGQPRFRFTSV